MIILNIGQDKCISVLENGAEILYYCDDRAVQNVFEKDQLSDDVSYHRTVSCNPTLRKLLTTTAVCQDYSCTLKRALVCFLSSFIREL